MAGAVSTFPTRVRTPRRATAESPVVKVVLITTLVIFFALFLVLPLFVVFQEAFSKGVETFIKTFEDRATAHAVKLTLIVAAIAVPLNTIFGLAAAWAMTRFQFRGRALLTSLIDLPLWVSPVIGGLIYVLVFGAGGWFGPWLRANDIQIIFALPGLVIATIFVTFPFVARGLIPLMQAQGHKEEEAAMTLGASGWQIFWRVTLPKIKWGLLYGVILCNARAMGEFGAVSVVSGHIRNKTNTMPLHIEILYNEYQIAAAFAVASVLSVLALVTLVVKAYAEWRAERQLMEAMQTSEGTNP
ncbi:sulfate transport system permease protein [Terrimicrobium sacchariphilum]|jgi:sulfate transport system permease protein|uniref:Sulfate transport system permease protein CysW n=1 Tax=Terrimicrobium sacchariphilum TaxID=690879 RepID=A0A146G945_TERSA|nr:sulfate ABC transporter permease subunit CysW [Terrimicrobium sacchariphilum]GAT33802.1 sulfate transport system permease protein [Terrimicrobium sacchariphilum]